MTVVSGKAVSRKWNVLAATLFFAAAGCQMTAYDDPNGTRYIRGSAGLNVGQPEGQTPVVPALATWDVPVMHFEISSPAATEVFRLAMIGSGSVLDWAVDGVGKLLGAD